MLPSIVASLVIVAQVQSAPLPLPRPASAPLREVTAWGPDSVVTLGGRISHYQPFWGLILPAPGGDLIAYWSKLDTNPFARVTRSGGIVFVTSGWYTTTRLGVTVDASGDVLEAFAYSPYPPSGNFDIAFERTTPAGQGEAPHLAHDPTSFNELAASAAAGPLGGAYIAWTRSSSYGPYFLQRVTSSGTIVAGWNPTGLRIRPPQPSGWPDPVLLPDGSGGVYMLASADVMRLWRVQSDTTLAVGWPSDGVPVSAARYDGGSMPSDLALVPGPAGHAFAVWVEVDNSIPTKTRVAMRSFDGNGNMDGPVVGLTPFASRDNNGANTIGKLRAQGDGQGGMLVRWQRGVQATVEFAHVLANGTVGAGPVPIPGSSGIVTSGPGGGYWVFWTDPAAMWEQLYTTDGTPVAEPQLLETPGYYHPWPMDAYPDGDGGAYLLSVGASGLVQMRHFVPMNVADVGPRPRDSRIALVVAPNPARRELRLGVTLFGEQAASLELLDVAGRRVLTQILPAGASEREERIALPSGLPSGVYLVSLRQGSRAAMRRVAIIQ